MSRVGQKISKIIEGKNVTLIDKSGKCGNEAQLPLLTIWDLLDKICRVRGESTSSFVHMTVRREFAQSGFLSQDEVKALEINLKEVEPNAV